jgi:hypothetical protein
MDPGAPLRYGRDDGVVLEPLSAMALSPLSPNLIRCIGLPENRVPLFGPMF